MNRGFCSLQCCYFFFPYSPLTLASLRGGCQKCSIGALHADRARLILCASYNSVGQTGRRAGRLAGRQGKRASKPMPDFAD